MCHLKSTINFREGSIYYGAFHQHTPQGRLKPQGEEEIVLNNQSLKAFSVIKKATFKLPMSLKT